MADSTYEGPAPWESSEVLTRGHMPCPWISLNPEVVFCCSVLDLIFPMTPFLTLRTFAAWKG